MHGVTVSTSLVLRNNELARHFDVEHLDTSDHRTVQNIGSWDLKNVIGAFSAIGRLALRVGRGRGVVYLPISQSTPGFLRDSLLVLISRIAGWKVAAHLRGSDFRAFIDSSATVWQWWIRFTLRRLESVAVLGESLRWIFDGLIAEERLVVVPNGTPEPRTMNVVRDPNHVLFLSNLLLRKGIVQSVEAACLVIEEMPTARFTFAGAWESPALKQQLLGQVSHTDGAITFTGPATAEDRDRLLASASVLLFPPVRPEGHPRVVIEALAAGLAVVTTDRGAIGETIRNGESGFVLAEPDPAEIAERLVVLLRDDQLRFDMSRAARRRYSEYFTQEIADRKLASWLARVWESPKQVASRGDLGCLPE